ncbi:MAG TPA: S41 family peptidase [Terriglobia bacterium]|nr:S41 family peptidase [Terriglobia bacterium]
MSNRIRLILISVSSVIVMYIVVGGVLGKSASKTGHDETYRDLGVYSEVLSRINSDYVTEPDLSKVTDGAIRGLLEALDPYSTYFTPAEFKDYMAHPDPGPAGVGIFFSKRYGYAPVVSVLPGSPAEKAGIKPGDLLDRVGDSPTRELSVVQIKRLLGGAPGTSVTLWVVREARGEPEKIELTRAVSNDLPVVGEMKDEGTGYIRVATFEKGTTEKVAAKLKELTAQGATKVVLDLRNCAGGDPQEAVSTASLFLSKGLIVAYTEGQRSPRQNLMARPEGAVSNLPLAVLINRSTAGAAEIVADGIAGNQRGDVVGIPSFGVGVVEKVVPVGDGSGLLLAVAKYYGPDGKAIEDNGVTPNVLMTSPDETGGLADETTPEQFGGKDDKTLQKAIDVLKQKSVPAKAA